MASPSAEEPIGPKVSIYLTQVIALAGANLKARYRRTWAGLVWVALYPLILFGVQALIFSKVLRIDMRNYPWFLATGLLPWVFARQTLEMATSHFTSHASVLKAFPIDPRVHLGALIVENLFNLAIAMILVLMPLAWFFRIEAIRFLAIPAAAIPLFFGIAGLSWLLATAQVFFADLRYVAQFALTVGFYLTPIFYPRSLLPDELNSIIELNPFTQWIEPFRVGLLDGGLLAFGRAWLISAVIALATVAAASIYWRRKRGSLYARL